MFLMRLLGPAHQSAPEEKGKKGSIKKKIKISLEVILTTNKCNAILNCHRYLLCLDEL